MAEAVQIICSELLVIKLIAYLARSHQLGCDWNYLATKEYIRIFHHFPTLSLPRLLVNSPCLRTEGAVLVRSMSNLATRFTNNHS